MKTQILRFLNFFVLAIAASAVEIKPPIFVPASGLQLSLNTGGYKFFAGEASTSPAVTKVRVAKLGGLLPTREGFAASAILANTSRSAIPFEFNDAGAAGVKFRFSVSDADGALVWQSDTDLVSAQVITPATLGKGERWKRMVQIPLKVDGAWLKPGIYTLEATLVATPSVSAATIFEVANLPEVPTGDSGINGQVFEQAPPNPLARMAPMPVKAYIAILEKRLPNARYDHPAFTWSGQTDDAGNFKVATPPGVFIVTASRIEGPGVILNTGSNPTDTVIKPPLILDSGRYAFAEVSVDAGRYSEVTLTFVRKGASLGETGITGTVLKRSIVGQTASIPPHFIYSDTPCAGATVTMTEIQTPGVLYIRGPWVFTTKTDSLGKFKQLTPPGAYLVTATLGSTLIASETSIGITSPGRPITGSVEATVQLGQLTDVTLYLTSSIPLPEPL